MNPIAAKLEAAAQLDRRRQKQISNQIGTIDRLLGDDHGYDEEMAVLQSQLAEAQAERDELAERLKQLEKGS